MLHPSGEEVSRRDAVMARILEAIREDRKILLPPFRGGEEPSEFALHRIAENDYSGSIGEFRYQFEGEDDLLHLIVLRSNGQPLSVQEGRAVAGFVFPTVSTAVIWLKPGEYSQHFYLGHDELL